MSPGQQSGHRSDEPAGCPIPARAGLFREVRQPPFFRGCAGSSRRRRLEVPQSRGRLDQDQARGPVARGPVGLEPRVQNAGMLRKPASGALAMAVQAGLFRASQLLRCPPMGGPQLMEPAAPRAYPIPRGEDRQMTGAYRGRRRLPRVAHRLAHHQRAASRRVQNAAVATRTSKAVAAEWHRPG
jgi:hypothetical protein